MLIPTGVRVLARALKPVADEVGNHPVIVDEVGVEVQAIRAIVAVLTLMISGTNARAELLVGNDRAVRDYLGIHRQHRPRDGCVEGLARAVTQKHIPRIGAVSHGVFEHSRVGKISR